MQRYRPNHKLNAPLRGMAFIMMVLCLLAAPGWAGPLDSGNVPVNQDEGRQTPFSKDSVTITKKSLQHIFTYGPKYAVNRETLIVGIDGKQVSLKQLLVPCDAEVSYLVEKGIPTAKRIDIKRVAAGARWQWMSEIPQ